MSNKNSTFLKILTVIIITALLTLFLSEVILRKFTNYAVEYIMHKNSEYIYMDFDFLRLNVDSDLPYVNIWQIENLKQAKEKNKFLVKNPKYRRIIILGDSIASSGELKPGERGFPALLEELLKEEYPETDFEIILFSEGGYSTKEEVTGYQRYCRQLSPDLVILEYCHNDRGEMSHTVRWKNGRPALIAYRANVLYLRRVPGNRWLTEKFLVFQLLNELGIKALHKLNYSPEVGFCLSGEEKVRAGFKKLYELTSPERVPVCIVVFPFFIEESNLQCERMGKLIKGWCADFGFLHVDLSENYRGINYRDLRCSPEDEVHPNALGHKIASQAIFDKIKQSNVLNLKAAQ